MSEEEDEPNSNRSKHNKYIKQHYRTLPHEEQNDNDNYDFNHRKFAELTDKIQALTERLAKLETDSEASFEETSESKPKKDSGSLIEHYY